MPEIVFNAYFHENFEIALWEKISSNWEPLAQNLLNDFNEESNALECPSSGSECPSIFY